MAVNRNFKGIWIPKEIYLAPDLSWTEKILVMEIDSLDNDPELGCFASNKYFAEFLQLKSTGSAANLVSGLKRKSYVFELWSDGHSRGLYTLLRENNLHQKMKVNLNKNMKVPSLKNEGQPSLKNEHSNTKNIKTNINSNSVCVAPAQEFKSKFSFEEIVLAILTGKQYGKFLGTRDAHAMAMSFRKSGEADDSLVAFVAMNKQNRKKKK